ncbi:RICIN domain-containing protein [Streptomyces sp. NPDC058251]|uniref:RICIN domain-containing protein n=1 Tax=Streptomyces sp. NPDC058251 TaxID=3346404 RepID=UPI0036E9DE8F
MRTSVAAAVLGLALTGLLSAPAAGSTAAVADLNYKQVTNKNSAKCADVEAWSKDDGAAVHQWSCRDYNNLNQLWAFAPTNHPGYFNLVNRNSYKCLDVAGPSYEDGARVHQWHCYGGPSQEWKIDYVDGTWYRLVNYYSGKCLDVEAASTADGATIHQWSCLPTGNSNQLWRTGG